jgi:DNA-binding NarL/FixJ family response regulator
LQRLARRHRRWWVLASDGHGGDRRHHRDRPARRARVQALRLIARGSLNREVADRLSIWAKTAGPHVGYIYGKVGITIGPAAVQFAMEHDLQGRHASRRTRWPAIFQAFDELL